MFAVYTLISLTKTIKTMTTQRQESIEKVLKVMKMTESRGGDYKDFYALCSYAMPESKDLEGLTPSEASTLQCGESCPRAFGELISELEDEFELAGGVVILTDKELKRLELQRELRLLKK